MNLRLRPYVIIFIFVEIVIWMGYLFTSRNVPDSWFMLILGFLFVISGIFSILVQYRKSKLDFNKKPNTVSVLDDEITLEDWSNKKNRIPKYFRVAEFFFALVNLFIFFFVCYALFNPIDFTRNFDLEAVLFYIFSVSNVVVTIFVAFGGMLRLIKEEMNNTNV